MTNLTTNKIRLQTQWRVSWPLVILEGSLASSYTCGRYWSGVLGCFLHHHHSKWGTINAIIAMVFTLTNRDIERCLGTLKLFWWDMTDQCLLKWFMPGFFFFFFSAFFPKDESRKHKTPQNYIQRCHIHNDSFYSPVSVLQHPLFSRQVFMRSEVICWTRCTEQITLHVWDFLKHHLHISCICHWHFPLNISLKIYLPLEYICMRVGSNCKYKALFVYTHKVM